MGKNSSKNSSILMCRDKSAEEKKKGANIKTTWI
jgi:hypothetical protein